MQFSYDDNIDINKQSRILNGKDNRERCVPAAAAADVCRH
jgi:hypothetical protein